jgi:hypothetical protein
MDLRVYKYSHGSLRKMDRNSKTLRGNKTIITFLQNRSPGQYLIIEFDNSTKKSEIIYISKMDLAKTI